jgi:hypothetical protein
MPSGETAASPTEVTGTVTATACSFGTVEIAVLRARIGGAEGTGAACRNRTEDE